MAEQEQGPTEDQASEESAEESTPSTEATPRNVREVVGRRGYDEAEDETVNEDEQH